MKNKNEEIFWPIYNAKTHQDNDPRLTAQTMKEHEGDGLHWGVVTAFQAPCSELYKNACQ